MLLVGKRSTFEPSWECGYINLSLFELADSA